MPYRSHHSFPLRRRLHSRRRFLPLCDRLSQHSPGACLWCESQAEAFGPCLEVQLGRCSSTCWGEETRVHPPRQLVRGFILQTKREAGFWSPAHQRWHFWFWVREAGREVGWSQRYLLTHMTRPEPVNIWARHSGFLISKPLESLPNYSPAHNQPRSVRPRPDSSSSIYSTSSANAPASQLKPGPNAV